MPADLNVTLSHRLSVALVWGSIVPAIAFAFTGSPAAALLTVAMLATLLFLNRDLYRFFARERGAMFAVCSVPLHWLYYTYCGLAVWIALGVHWRQRRSQRVPRLTSPGP